MRSTLYWLISSSVAALSMHATAETHHSEMPLAFTDALTHSAAVPEIARSILLGIGILAVAYTYRQAWLNHSAA